jgi:tRNA(fMet)-specific endonuclease VapC
MTYLLDTNICAFYLNGNKMVCQKMERIGYSNIFVSEITVLELYYGAEKSTKKEQNKLGIAQLLKIITVIPISVVLIPFGIEKLRLNQLGTPLDNFDLLIGITSVHHNMTMVTNNTKHFERIQGVVLEDWSL